MAAVRIALIRRARCACRSATCDPLFTTGSQPSFRTGVPPNSPDPARPTPQRSALPLGVSAGSLGRTSRPSAILLGGSIPEPI